MLIALQISKSASLQRVNPPMISLLLPIGSATLVLCCKCHTLAPMLHIAPRANVILTSFMRYLMSTRDSFTRCCPYHSCHTPGCIMLYITPPLMLFLRTMFSATTVLVTRGKASCRKDLLEIYHQIGVRFEQC